MSEAVHLHWLIRITSWVDGILHSSSTILAASKKQQTPMQDKCLGFTWKTRNKRFLPTIVTLTSQSGHLKYCNAEHRRIDAFELWCWRRLSRVPWTAKRSVLGVHWKDWCWSWSSDTLATSCKDLTHGKRTWCWEELGAGAEGDNRGWDGWMASAAPWTWVWVNSGCWWWIRRHGMLWFMGSQRVGHDWATKLNWT